MARSSSRSSRRPPRSAYDDLVSGGQFGELSHVAGCQAVSDYCSMLEFFAGQLDYFRESAISISSLAGRGIAMRSAPEREFKLRIEVDAGRVAADGEAMSLLSEGLRNQLVSQEFRRGVLAKAGAMCAALSEAVGRPRA